MPRLATLALLCVLVPGAAAPAQDAVDEQGPPAFVPDERASLTAALADARFASLHGRSDEAAGLYQAVVDGPDADLLATSEEHEGVLEQARERAHREMAHLEGPEGDDLRAAYVARFETRARDLLDAALARGGRAGLREAFQRFPLTPSGARAGLLLARDLHRAGIHGRCLGVLDRLRGLWSGRPIPTVDADDLVLLTASAAARDGDADLVARLRASRPAGDPLEERLADLEARAAAGGSAGPRGPLSLLWSWRPDPQDRHREDYDLSARGMQDRGVLPRPEHSVAVRHGIVYWTGPYHVTGLDLLTGEVRSRSVPVDGRPSTGMGPDNLHEGEWFQPAADDLGVVAAQDISGGTREGRRTGSLLAFDGSLRTRFRRGGPGDVEYPFLGGRYCFHGRPLLLGDRVYIGATESAAEEGKSGGDVRTHVLAFRRSDLALLWDRFVAYGSGVRVADSAPTGSISAHHGRLYVASHTGLEACLDERTGTLLWARRYKTPRRADTARLQSKPDLLTVPTLWPASPPVFSGDWVAFTPRDSGYVDFLRQMPAPDGSVRTEWRGRPRHDSEDLDVQWVLPGPGGSFFQAGRAGRLAAPLVLRTLEEDKGDSQVVWRGAIMEPAIAGLPVRTADALYAATSKALYRIPWPGRDGEVERLASVPSSDASGEFLPRAGNVVVLENHVLSISNQGILCFGPAPPREPGEDR